MVPKQLVLSRMSNKPSMRKEWQLTEEVFAKFLAWLHPNREEAGKKYEDIRRRLITIFASRGCACPEDLADETINRCIWKSKEIAATYVGDPALYFHGVAHNVYREYLRRKPDLQFPPTPKESSHSEDDFVCLDQCMQQITPWVEDDLIEDFISGALSAQEENEFETLFLLTLERRQKLNFAKVLRLYVGTQVLLPPRI